MTEQRPTNGSRYTSHACEDRVLSEYEVKACQNAIQRTIGKLYAHDHALDVGCGTSGDGEQILAPAKYTGIDRHGPSVAGRGRKYFCADLLSHAFGWPPLHFGWSNVVLSKRMLCQLPEGDHAEALRRMWRLVRPGGALVLCEPSEAHRAALNAARVSAGLRALPEPVSGGHLLSIPAAESVLGRLCWYNKPVAAEYVLWTRFLRELLCGSLPRYDKVEARVPLVAPSADLVRSAAFYRVVTFRKS